MCQSCVGRLFSENKTAETNKYTLSTFDSKGVLPDPAAIRTHTHTHTHTHTYTCMFMYVHLQIYVRLRRP